MRASNSPACERRGLGAGVRIANPAGSAKPGRCQTDHRYRHAPEPRSRMLGKWMSTAMVVGIDDRLGHLTCCRPRSRRLVPMSSSAGVLTGVRHDVPRASPWHGWPRRSRADRSPMSSTHSGRRPRFVTLWCYCVLAGDRRRRRRDRGRRQRLATSIRPSVSGPALIAVAIGSIVGARCWSTCAERGPPAALQIVTVLIKLFRCSRSSRSCSPRFGAGQPLEPLAPVPLSLGGVDRGSSADPVFADRVRRRRDDRRNVTRIHDDRPACDHPRDRLHRHDLSACDASRR